MLLRYTTAALSAVFFVAWGMDAWSLINEDSQNHASAEQVEKWKSQFRKPTHLSYPKYNLYTPEKERLGKLLFFDPLLSRTQALSCASCHQPDYDFTDPFPRALGKDQKPVRRRTQTLLNIAFGLSFFWDGRARTLEEQATMPIEAPDEMDLSISELIERLKNHPEYPRLFKSSFPKEGINQKTVAQALATFERGIVSQPAPFDFWLEGNETAISEQAKRGFVLFNEKAKCVTCHTGWNFTNGSFADTGLSPADYGKGKVIGLALLNHGFKTPTLRNISTRSPYMHDGSLASLEEVIEHYNRGGTHIRESTRLFLSPLGLEQNEKEDLVEFLKSLTSKKGVL